MDTTPVPEECSADEYSCSHLLVASAEVSLLPVSVAAGLIGCQRFAQALRFVLRQTVVLERVERLARLRPYRV